MCKGVQAGAASFGVVTRLLFTYAPSGSLQQELPVNQPTIGSSRRAHGASRRDPVRLGRITAAAPATDRSPGPLS